jgi:hypothetical protein
VGRSLAHPEPVVAPPFPPAAVIPGRPKAEPGTQEMHPEKARHLGSGPLLRGDRNDGGARPRNACGKPALSLTLRKALTPWACPKNHTGASLNPPRKNPEKTLAQGGDTSYLPLAQFRTCLWSRAGWWASGQEAGQPPEGATGLRYP